MVESINCTLVNPAPHSFRAANISSHTPGSRPPPELPVHSRPFAEMLMQIAPLRARARDPEHSIKHPPIVRRRPTALAARRNHKRCEKPPFPLRHQPANHRYLPKDSLESALARLGNPFCQQLLVWHSIKLTMDIPLISRNPQTAWLSIFAWSSDCSGYLRSFFNALVPHCAIAKTRERSTLHHISRNQRNLLGVIERPTTRAGNRARSGRSDSRRFEA